MLLNIYTQHIREYKISHILTNSSHFHDHQTIQHPEEPQLNLYGKY